MKHVNKLDHVITPNCDALPRGLHRPFSLPRILHVLRDVVAVNFIVVVLVIIV